MKAPSAKLLKKFSAPVCLKLAVGNESPVIAAKVGSSLNNTLSLAGIDINRVNKWDTKKVAAY
ncbi:hypothetical protein ACTXT7_015760 [Hymenolepis weldensis]